LRKLSAAALFLVCLTFPFSANSGQQTPAEAAPAASSPPAQSGNQASPALPQGQPAETSKTNKPLAAVQTMQSGAAYESATVLRVTTRLVMLDVVATDSHGHAVFDLESRDFTVLEDGKPQKVRAFGFQHPLSSPPKAAQTERPALPANVFTNIPQFQLSSSLNVILLDALNTPLTNQSYARQKMLHYLETMPSDSPTAVFTLGEKLRMLQDFTIDPNILKEAVRKANGQLSPLLDNSVSAEEQVLPRMIPADLPPDVQESIERFEAERTAVQTDLRVRYTLDALQSIGHWLEGYQGRKNLIWISEAFPFAISPDTSVHRGAEFAGTRHYSDDLSKTAELLTDAQVAIYPVDPRGLEPPGSFSGVSTGADRFGRLGVARTGGIQLGSALQQESSSLFAAHDAMDLLADRTGGKAYYNRNDLDGAVRDGISDGSTYYMLGYYPDNKEWDGKFRKIQVKVERHGVTLRYRLGYYASDPAAYLKEDEKQRARELGDALNLDHPVSTALFFEAQVMPPSEPGKGNVTIGYAVDLHALRVEHGEDGTEHADVECVVQAFDENGKPVNSGGSTVKAAMKQETFQKVLKSGLPCKSEIALPAGNYLLRLAVRDNRTGLIGTANAKVNVPKLTEAKVQ
jgi:VWFA-related protein